MNKCYVKSLVPMTSVQEGQGVYLLRRGRHIRKMRVVSSRNTESGVLVDLTYLRKRGQKEDSSVVIKDIALERLFPKRSLAKMMADAYYIRDYDKTREKILSLMEVPNVLENRNPKDDTFLLGLSLYKEHNRLAIRLKPDTASVYKLAELVGVDPDEIAEEAGEPTGKDDPFRYDICDIITPLMIALAITLR